MAQWELAPHARRVLAWLTGGKSLHNNHHAYPPSPKFSTAPSNSIRRGW
jgi:fatty-acid desaturase